MTDFQFETYDDSNDPKCEFCGRQYRQDLELEVTFGKNVCLLEDCESVKWFTKQVEVRYPLGVPGRKDFNGHHFVMEFEPEDGFGNHYLPRLRCTDPCPTVLHLYRMVTNREYVMCSCEALHECFDDPAMWIDGMEIKVRPVYHSYRTFEGDWDADAYIEIIGDDQ